MKEIILIACELLSTIIPFLLTFILYTRTRKKRGAGLKTNTKILVVMLALYATVVFHVTGAGTLYDALRYRLALSPEQVNLLPFSKEIDPVGYFLNLVLFLPLGILTPLLRGNRRPLLFTAGTGAAFSMLIEGSQLLNNRRTDIDDLILNTLGAILGLALYCVWNRGRKAENHGEPVSTAVFLMSFLVPFLGRFFLFNEMGLAKALYGF